MDDHTAELVNWLSRGRTSALVAPAVRAATTPGARRSAERARDMAATARQIDSERLRRIVEELRDDRDFRAGLALAGGSVRHAVEASGSGRRRRRGLMMLALAAVAGIAVMVWRRTGARAPVDPMPSPNGAAPHQQTAPFSMHGS